MKKIILTPLLIICQMGILMAQTKISGTIQNDKGKKLTGVNISVTDTYDGGTSNDKGYYSFYTDQKGKAILSFSILGYISIDKNIVIENDSINIDVVMKEAAEELDAVVVTAGSFEAGDKKRAATVFNKLDILTTGGANADISASIKTLPGTQQIGEQEGLAVRGGSTNETNQYVDGTLVSKPYFTGPTNIAQRGRFSPVLFKGTIFSAGGYSALYGQALSSALILESIDLPTMSQADLAISYAYASAGFQHLMDNKKASWGVNYSYTNLTPYFNTIKQKFDYTTMPEYHTFDGNFRIKTKWGGMIKYYTSYSKSKTGIDLPNVDSDILTNNMHINNTNWYNNLSWREYLGNNWKMDLGLSYSYNLDKFHQQLYDNNRNPVTLIPSSADSSNNFTAKTHQDFAQAKIVFEKKLWRNNTIRFGADYWYENGDNTYNNLNRIMNDNLIALFIENDVHLSSKVALKIGARTEYSSIINKWNVAPRLSVAYKTGKYSQVSAAYGLFYQKPSNNILLNTTNLNHQMAAHYILNYNYSTTGRTMRVEAFYKQYNDLVKTAPKYSSDGSGYAGGAEIFWRDKTTFRMFDYWLSYSYVNTKRDYLNYPERLQPGFAANHTATLVLKRFFPKIQTGFNFTYSFASGRPYYNFMQNTNDNNYHIADQGKTKNYNDLALSINYVTRIWGANAVIYASANNLLGQNNVFGYNYSSNGAIKHPITPSADRFYFVAVFLSWGVDRSKDILDGRY